MRDVIAAGVIIMLALALGFVVIRYGRKSDPTDAEIEAKAQSLYLTDLPVGAVHPVPWHSASEAYKTFYRRAARDRLLAERRVSSPNK